MNILENKNISALIINTDGLIYSNVNLGKNTQNSLTHVTQNHKLVEAIDNILYHGFKVIWISRSTTDALKHTIKAITGNLHEKTSIVGHELITAKNDLCFYERLAYEALKKRNIAPDEAILISNHKLNSNGLSVEKTYATLIAESPEKLVQCLEYINFCYLLN